MVDIISTIFCGLSNRNNRWTEESNYLMDRHNENGTIRTMSKKKRKIILVFVR